MNTFKADKIVLRFQMGQFRDIYTNAVSVANQCDCEHVEFEFNGVQVVVSKESPDELTAEQWETVQLAIDTGNPLVFI
jgi:hypothetical protein